MKNFNVGGYAYATALALLIMLNLSLSTYFLVKGDGVYNYNIGSRRGPGFVFLVLPLACAPGGWRLAPAPADSARLSKAFPEPASRPARVAACVSLASSCVRVHLSVLGRTYTGLITNTMLVSTKIVGFWSCAPENRPPGAIGSDRLLSHAPQMQLPAAGLQNSMPCGYRRDFESSRPSHVLPRPQIRAIIIHARLGHLYVHRNPAELQQSGPRVHGEGLEDRGTDAGGAECRRDRTGAAGLGQTTGRGWERRRAAVAIAAETRSSRAHGVTTPRLDFLPTTTPTSRRQKKKIRIIVHSAPPV